MEHAPIAAAVQKPYATFQVLFARNSDGKYITHFYYGASSKNAVASLWDGRKLMMLWNLCFIKDGSYIYGPLGSVQFKHKPRITIRRA